MTQDFFIALESASTSDLVSNSYPRTSQTNPHNQPHSERVVARLAGRIQLVIGHRSSEGIQSVSVLDACVLAYFRLISVI